MPLLPAAIDTFLLRIQSRLRRARIAGFGKISIPKRRVVYLDAGLHQTAEQIALMLKWFGQTADLQIHGLEAHPDYARECQRLFAGDPRVQIHNFALVGPDHRGSTDALHLDGQKGLGNSLFAARGGDAISVPAIRLSDFLRINQIVCPGDIVLLRMNIEGAEMQVIEDLATAGMIGQIDGFYGMWDDLYKIDPALDEKFRALMRREGVRTFTFNDRDAGRMAPPERIGIIRYDIETSLYRGDKRKSRVAQRSGTRLGTGRFLSER